MWSCHSSPSTLATHSSHCSILYAYVYLPLASVGCLGAFHHNFACYCHPVIVYNTQIWSRIDWLKSCIAVHSALGHVANLVCILSWCAVAHTAHIEINGIVGEPKVCITKFPWYCLYLCHSIFASDHYIWYTSRPTLPPFFIPMFRCSHVPLLLLHSSLAPLWWCLLCQA